MSFNINGFVILFIGLILILGVCAAAHWFTMKHLDQFGTANDLKHKTADRSLGNLAIIAALCIIVLMGYTSLMSKEFIASCFVSGLAALGFKVITENKK